MGLLDRVNAEEILGRIKKVKDDLFASDQNLSKPSSTGKFCSNCGTKISFEEKFCHNCGNKVLFNSENNSNLNPQDYEINQSEIKENSLERSQQFAGSIQKCPNCGCTISDTVAICPDCGMQISGRVANLTVQDFKNQLMAIESSRKGGIGGALSVYLAADKADVQKLTLIRNFPIPNSIGDILEFMMLAIANIDVKLSKNTFFNRLDGGLETGATIGRTISNAWVAKMEQVYRKAEILFPDDPAFSGIQKMYFDKMKELNIKIKHFLHL